jgi:type IV pilus assembly protein PilM
MFGFSKTNSVLGVDIGATSVKIVELKSEKGAPVLVNYAYSEQPPRAVEKSNLQMDIPMVVKIITELRDKAGLHSTQAVAAMPSFSVFTSVLHIAGDGKKPEELESAVLWEAKKVVPLALDEMMLDWQVIGTGNAKPAGGAPQPTEGAAEGANVLLTGAPKNLVKKYIDVFKQADLQLVSLETEMFSLIRSLIGSDPATIALVDLGAVNTDIAIVENGLPLFTRSLDTGGVMVTRAVADALKVDFKRAEQFKFDLSMAGDAALEQSGGMPTVVKNTLAPIVNEIRYSFNLFQQENNKKIEKVVLAGGGAGLVGIAPYLSELLQTNVVLGDPWARISCPQQLSSVLDEISSRMAIAAGLALREVG